MINPRLTRTLPHNLPLLRQLFQNLVRFRLRNLVVKITRDIRGAVGSILLGQVVEDERGSFVGRGLFCGWLARWHFFLAMKDVMGVLWD